MTHKFSCAMLGLMLGILGGCVAAPPRSGLPVVNDIASYYLEQTAILGMTIAVSRDGSIVHEAGYGKARRSPDIAADAHTPFEFFSVGKPVIAALAMSLAERGQLDLDAPAATLVDGLREPYATATLRELLRHTSGIREVVIDESAPAPRFLLPPSVPAVLAWLAESERVTAPGETWLYNNSGFVVAALAAEQASGSSYAELVREEIAVPLDLRAFGYCPDFDGVRAAGYMVVDSKPVPIPTIDFGWFSGAGSLCATMGDLLRWWTAHREGRFMTQAALAEMFEPVTLEHDGTRAAFGYGLGIRIGSYLGHRMIGHTGNGAGGTSVLVEYPDDGLMIAVATNTAGRDVPHALEIQAAIARALLEVQQAPPSHESVPSHALAAASGYFRSPEGAFCIGRRDSALTVAVDGGEPEQLLHQGNGRFQRTEDRTNEEYFLNWPERSQWFAYDLYGFPMDLALRISESCPTAARPTQ